MCVEEKVIQNIPQDAHVCEHIENFQFSYSDYMNMMIFLRKLIIITTKCFILFYLKNEESLADSFHTSRCLLLSEHNQPQSEFELGLLIV